MPRHTDSLPRPGWVERLAHAQAALGSRGAQTSERQWSRDLGVNYMTYRGWIGKSPRNPGYLYYPGDRYFAANIAAIPTVAEYGLDVEALFEWIKNGRGEKPADPRFLPIAPPSGPGGGAPKQALEPARPPAKAQRLAKSDPKSDPKADDRGEDIAIRFLLEDVAAGRLPAQEAQERIRAMTACRHGAVPRWNHTHLGIFRGVPLQMRNVSGRRLKLAG